MRKSTFSSLVLPVLAAAVLAGCSPTYNWRDYNSPDAPFSAMFPDKPVAHTRSVNLDGMNVDMTMTAAEIDGTMFAIGTGEAPDAAKAAAAVTAMKTALVKNIGATVTSEKSSATASAGGAGRAHGNRHRGEGHAERSADAPRRPFRSARQTLLPGDRHGQGEGRAPGRGGHVHAFV